MTEASGGGGTRSAAIEEVKDVASETRAAAVASDRLDLVARIDARASRLDDPASHVLVVGEYKQGKSSLVNALVGSAVCPVDDDIASAVPVTVRFGDVASAALVVAARITDGATEPPTPERRSVSIEDVSRLATEAGDPGEGQRSLEVALPSEVLADGLVLVDTPGVGGLGSMEATATMGALPMADAVVFVTDASQELTGAEAIFLRQASALCPNILCALTKTDFYGAWPKMRDLDLEHLERLDLPIEVLPISSALHERARETGDPILDDESGFPQLQHALRTRVIEGAEVVAIRAAVADLHAVLSQLAGPLAAERRALVLPEALGTARREVEEARAAAKERTKQTARWQHTLADGFQDLLADVEHDLRRRFRLINQEADETIDSMDPADAWDEFEAWLSRKVAEDVVENYRYLHARAQDLSVLVADHFDDPVRPEALDGTAAQALGTSGLSAVRAEIDVEKMGPAAAAMSAVRGGYIGMLMFGVLGSVIGVALGPLPLGVGLVTGRKQLREEKNRQLVQRRQQARNAQRKYMDEVMFLASKDMRDAARRVNRTLRDFYTDRAEEQARSVNEELAALDKAARIKDEARQRRVAELDGELGRLRALHGRLRSAIPA